MIQNIGPLVYDNQYMSGKEPGEDAFVFCFSGRDVLIGEKSNEIRLPRAGVWKEHCDFRYLFKIGEQEYYMAPDGSLPSPSLLSEAYLFRPVQTLFLMHVHPQELLFAAFNALHLHDFYAGGKFCGACGKKMRHHDKMRALVCKCCGNLVFPRINPAVVAAVTDGDRILITRYRQFYDDIALIAGFNEVGESLEDTVRREVMEEVGLKVRNLRYCGSQPWGVADNLMAGYFCEVDGDPEAIRMDAEELKESRWIRREEIPPELNAYSLTYEMMLAFREGRERSLLL